MEEGLLSITELAKLREVTSETLRYYDRIGLLKPTYVNPENGYRYYSIRQYERLGTIKELRALGCSIEEIQEYFDDRNLEKSLSILKKHQRRLQREIQEKLLAAKTISTKLNFLENQSVPALPCNVPIEFQYPTRHMITFGEVAGGPHEHAYAFTRLEQHLEEVAPIIASDRIGVYCDERLLEQTTGYIPCVPMVFVNPDEVKSINMVTVERGQYVCMRYRGSTGLEEYNPAFKVVKQYLHDHNLKIRDKIFQVYKIDKTVTDRPNELLLEIQVPIEREAA